MKNLKTFEQAAKSVKIDPTILPDVSILDEATGRYLIAAYKLSVISKAAWGKIAIDWNNSSQYKYYPWFYLKNGFSYGRYGYYGSDSDVGSRLCYPSSVIAEYVGKTHLDLYKDLMIL